MVSCGKNKCRASIHVTEKALLIRNIRVLFYRCSHECCIICVQWRIRIAVDGSRADSVLIVVDEETPRRRQRLDAVELRLLLH